MISIKDYARESGVSYEAVRRQVKRYEAELDGHIHRQGRIQFLDDEAVGFLDDHRAKTPVALFDGATDRRIQELESENKELLKRVNEVQKQLIEEKDKAHQAQLQAARVELLEAAAADREERIQKAAADLQTAQEKMYDAQAVQRAAELKAEELKIQLEAEAAARAAAEEALAAEQAKSKWEKFRDLFRKDGKNGV